MENESTRSDVLDRRVGDLVAENYARAAVFARAGIDFCCGGGRTVAEACTGAGVAAASLIAQLDAVDSAAFDEEHGDVSTWSIAQLVGHIQDEHHAYVQRNLPVLEQWADKVARVHGKAHPELVHLRALVRELSIDLRRHLRDEEDTVFPRLVALERNAGDDPEGRGIPREVVAALEEDHEHAGSLMRRARELTDDFTPPPDACSTYKATFSLLEEFEADLHRHVHLENNVLFPRALEALR